MDSNETPEWAKQLLVSAVIMVVIMMIILCALLVLWAIVQVGEAING